jgi:hypothetical protein
MKELFPRQNKKIFLDKIIINDTISLSEMIIDLGIRI